MLYPFFRLCRPARSPASCGPAARKKRGFSLIEAAIVLGVVGLVIGGIWAAAASVNEKFYTNKLETEFATIQNRLIDTFAREYVSYSEITSALANGGLVPAEMINGSGLMDSYGQTIKVGLNNNPAYPMSHGTNYPKATIQIQANSLAHCVSAVKAIVSYGQRLSLGGCESVKGVYLDYDMSGGAGGPWSSNVSRTAISSSSSIAASARTAKIACPFASNTVNVTFPFCN